MARFLHLADIHLGSHQYQNAERNLDFFRSFWAVVDRHAVAGEVDFVLIAGDLFDKRSIDAPTLGQATAVLKSVAERGIPVIGVEGNHDRAYYGEGSSWLEYLNGLGLLRLLRNDIGDDGAIVLHPWVAGQRPGAYLDIGDIRVIGSRYYGASTVKAIGPMADAIRELPPAPYTLLVWHMGLEGYISSLAGGVSVTQLEPLRQCTDYLALGHVHTRYDVEEWLYNPGPLEPCNITEAAMPHGALKVTVTSSGHTVEPVEDYPRRTFCRVSFEMTPYDSPAELQAAFPAFLAKHLGQTFDLPPIVEVTLTGTCRFSRSALDSDWIRQMVIATCAPLVVLLRNNAGTGSTAIAPDAHSTMDRQELERLILQDCFAQDSRYRETSGQCSQLILELKNRVENGEKPLSLLNYLKEAVPAALQPAPAIEIVAAVEPVALVVAAAVASSPPDSTTAEPVGEDPYGLDDDDSIPPWLPEPPAVADAAEVLLPAVAASEMVTAPVVVAPVVPTVVTAAPAPDVPLFDDLTPEVLPVPSPPAKALVPEMPQAAVITDVPSPAVEVFDGQMSLFG